MYCVYCGAKNADVANFCSNCGKEEISEQTEEVIESSDEPQSKIRVHHPWMRAQPSQEQSRQQVQPQPPERQEPQEQDDGEVSELVKRIQGWSVKKKILWGTVAGFLILVCVGVIAREPSEDSATTAKSINTPRPEPTLMNDGCQNPSREQVRNAIEIAIREAFEESIPPFKIEWDTDPVTGGKSPGISDSRRWNEYSKRYARVVNADVILKSTQSSGQIKVWFSGVIYDDCTYNIWTSEVK